MMDTIKSFKGYGKVDEREEQAFRRKTRKRLIIVLVSTVVLVTVVIGAVAGTLIHKRNSGSDGASSSSTSPAASVKAVCSVTQYPESCFTSISALQASNSTPTTDPEEIFRLSLRVVLNELSGLLDKLPSKTDDPSVQQALTVCHDVFQDAIESLNDSISSMEANDAHKLLSPSIINDIRTWLSTTVTDQETCLDALGELNSTAAATVLEDVKVLVTNSTEFASNSLAIVAKILGILGDFKIPIHRRLLHVSGLDFPDWVKLRDRRLLQETNPKPDVTVAADGSGDVRTIKAAVDRVPKKSKSRFVIYVKRGRYLENVVLEKYHWNVMMYGDGSNQTIVSGSKNFVDGTPTFSTATFAATGKGFIAKGMGFENTAGPQKHQAVAFRSGSDQSVYDRCSFSAFQDTLYAHSNRQFYKECDITGTVDFIFGNAAVVFQNCNIKPRQPMAGQFVTVTAQGKKDPNQNTGISIQKCSMFPLDNLTATAYLGRPWKAYSTTIIMQTNIGPFLNPSGWTEWIGNVEPPKTIFYGEYQNTGPGSSVNGRVKWAGYRPNLRADQASMFTVQAFLQGGDWLPATNVEFQSTL